MSTRNVRPRLVGDVVLPLDRFPVVSESTLLKEALEEMGRSRLGIVCIVDAENRLLGIVTDGDIRRRLLEVQKPFSAFFVDDALDHAIREPLTVMAEDTLLEAVSRMGLHGVWDLPVTDEAGVLVGLLHLHPAVQALLGAE